MTAPDSPLTRDPLRPGPRPGQVPAVMGVFAAALAVFVVPLVLGSIAMVLGAIAWLRGERRGRWVIVVAVLAIGVGLLFDLIPNSAWT